MVCMRPSPAAPGRPFDWAYFRLSFLRIPGLTRLLPALGCPVAPVYPEAPAYDARNPLPPKWLPSPSRTLPVPAM